MNIIKNKIIYFDNSATTRVLPSVIETITYSLEEFYGNPSSHYSIGYESREKIEETSYIISEFLGCEIQEIIYTSGACESNSLAISGYSKCHPNTLVITDTLEHKSILETVKKEKTKIVKLHNSGEIDLEDLENICKTFYNKKNIFVTIQSANSEIGVIQNIKAISDIVHRYSGVFHTDATQLIPYKKININSMGIDLLSMSGQKIGAPKGIGILYVSKKIKIEPIIFGSQMNGIRGGTENVPYILGLGEAIKSINYNNNNFILELKDYTVKKLNMTNLDFIINTPSVNALPNNLSISFKKIDGETLSILLDSYGICVSTGSACNSSSILPSLVLSSLNVPKDYIDGTIRVTFSKDNTKNEVDYFIDKLEKSINTLLSF